MTSTNHRLAFEREVYELEARLAKLESADDKSAEVLEEIRRLKRERVDAIKKAYNNLEPWETVQVARHPERPMAADYLNLAFDEFVELHGDKCFGDDRAILTGFAKLDEFKVLFIGHQKGRTYKERAACNFGCAHPEGYRKALDKMKLAAKFGLPVVTLIDTPGAYPGIGAEERGQAQIIADCIFEMSRLRTPIICVVIGEGGSGGALGVGVGDRVAILRHAYYSVISPEGCAGILWKSDAFKEQAARAEDHFQAPARTPGRRRRDRRAAGGRAPRSSPDGQHTEDVSRAAAARVDLAADRRSGGGAYEKFRRMGQFIEGGVPQLNGGRPLAKVKPAAVDAKKPVG